MKNFKIILTFIFAGFLLGNCSSQKQNSESDQNLRHEWLFVSFQNFSKEKLVKSEAKINLNIRSENKDQYSAKMGCNSLFFTAKIKSGNKIEFSQVGGTKMYCEGMMDLESAFGKALPMMTSYKVDGHYLTLSDGKGNEMKFLAADWD
ncbi:META domain-containing protein [Halpernia frigidisoli]|uniref:Heat shock protein HslJ n=1 Tax=Halpernia frigidisoli TaxID=1125876 RepID=A0A1I3H497_9FLAO|nr:META domain-containing protein [Halpernia frigidisoli]SFI30390.1 Heat shock protein HslJ [Halpernia frigidisoli]